MSLSVHFLVPQNCLQDISPSIKCSNVDSLEWSYSVNIHSLNLRVGIFEKCPLIAFKATKTSFQ